MKQARPLEHWFASINGLAAAMLSFMAAALAFNLGSYLKIVYYEEQAFALAVGLSLFLTYHKPARPAVEGKKARPAPQAWIECGIGWLILLGSIYFAYNFEEYSLAIVTQPAEIVIGGTILLVALLEAVRRMAGMPLVIVILLLFAYTLWGKYLPANFAAPETEFGSMVAYVVGDPNAILGSPVAVALIVVVPFIFMGEMLRISNGSSFFTDISLAAVGRSPGGSAKVAIVSSSLFGTISGSAVGNVVATGVISIPMMKKSGYSAEKAGAFEAVASTGGQLVPPVMGAAAFLMAEFLQVSYGEIILAALVPACLFYGSLYISAHLIAQREKIGGEHLALKAWDVMKSGWFFLTGLAALLYLLLSGLSRPEMAAFVAAIFFGLCGLVVGYRGTRMKMREAAIPVFSTGYSSVDIMVISAAAGIVVGLLSVSGLSFSLSVFLIDLANNNAFLLLFYTAIVSVILGMGMPTTGVYVLLATVVAPALVQLGYAPLVAHFFIFYFGMLSMITPPVAMAAYAGASVAGADPMRTGWAAVMLGWPVFIIPFLMAENNALLAMAPVHIVLLEAAMAMIGIAAITAAVHGYWRHALSLQGRLAYAGLGILTLVPVLAGDIYQAARIVIAIGLFLWMGGWLPRLMPKAASS